MFQLLKIEEPETCRYPYASHVTTYRMNSTKNPKPQTLNPPHDLYCSYVVLVATAAACSLQEQEALQGEQVALMRVLETIAGSEL